MKSGGAHVDRGAGRQTDRYEYRKDTQTDSSQQYMRKLKDFKKN